MRLLLGLFLLVSTLSINAVMLDENGEPRVEPYTVYEVNERCRMQGYFLLNDTLFMCAVVRENVTKEEYRASEEASGKRAVQRMMERFR